MNQKFMDLQCKCIIVYLVNILVFYDSIKQHLTNLQKVFKWLRMLQFKAKQQKCELGKRLV